MVSITAAAAAAAAIFTREHKKEESKAISQPLITIKKKGWHWMTQDIPADHLGREPQVASLTAAHPAIRPPNYQRAAYASETYSPARCKAWSPCTTEWATEQHSNK
jgi:hypothetical protein